MSVDQACYEKLRACNDVERITALKDLTVGDSGRLIMKKECVMPMLCYVV